MFVQHLPTWLLYDSIAGIGDFLSFGLIRILVVIEVAVKGQGGIQRLHFLPLQL